MESEAELELLERGSPREQGKTAPGLAAESIRTSMRSTHRKISTGKAEDKFGISWIDGRRSAYARAAALTQSRRASGIDMHIGSQITQLEPFEQAFTLLAELVVRMREAGHEIEHVDLGGGLGIPYRGTNDVPPHPDEYAAVVMRTVGNLGCRLMCEPGRMIAGNAGILVASVLYTKPGDAKSFTIVDAAMNDLIRPTLYDAFHDIVAVEEPADGARTHVTDVVGPVCETGDYLARDFHLPPVAPGDLIAILSAGAYGAVQSGTYNTRPLVPEVLVKGEEFAVVRARPSYDDLIGLDSYAGWQGS